MVELNGDIFEGNWINGVKEGFGSKYFSKNQIMMIGEWVNGQPVSSVVKSMNKYKKFQRLFLLEPNEIL